MSGRTPTYRVLQRGDPAPWFIQRTSGNPAYKFHTVAGRWVVLCYFATAADRVSQEALRLTDECQSLFDDEHACFFGASVDPSDESQRRVVQRKPGIRFFWDFDGEIGRAFGVVSPELGRAPVPRDVQRHWFILDPMLRIREAIAIAGPDGGRAKVAAAIRSLPSLDRYTQTEAHAPILMLADIFEPELCRKLIDLYERHGGEDSGFMREVDGKTALLTDYNHKRRADYRIKDPAIVAATLARVRRRIVPEIKKAHQFEVTRMERYIVACYDSTNGGHFGPHRDNVTKGTAHRRFAVSINLNADFDGGELMFPEYGLRRYKPAPGAAVVFSCSLLHAVTPMVSGRRFAFLPFLYNDDGARLRAANNAFLADNVIKYAGGKLDPAPEPDARD